MTIPAELALTKSLVDIAVASDSFERSDLAPAVARLFSNLDDPEALAAPRAMARALSACASDLHRWRALCDVAVRFDFYEVLGSLTRDLQENFDPQLLASAVTLSTNPAVPGSVREPLTAIRGQAPFLEPVDRMIRIRWGAIRPESDLEWHLDAQVWPGRHAETELHEVAPLVFVSDGADDRDKELPDGRAAAVLRVAAAVVEAGGRVRRVASTLESLPNPHWASPSYPFVTWSGSGVAHWRRLLASSSHRVATIVVTGDLRQPVAMSRLMNQIEDELPKGASFWRETNGLATTTDAFSPELLTEGAFDGLEMGYLGGLSRSALHRLVSKNAALEPGGGRSNQWTFDQLITVRLVQAFKAQNSQFRAVETVVGRLHEVASASSRSEVALDTNGRMYVRQEGQWVTVDGAQPALEDVLSIDDAFRPFALGDGRVPNLLLPSVHTAVHPAVLAGTPAIRDRRVAARAIALVAERGERALKSAYPELQPVEIQDGMKVGASIIALRGSSAA